MIQRVQDVQPGRGVWGQEGSMEGAASPLQCQERTMKSELEQSDFFRSLYINHCSRVHIFSSGTRARG